MSLSLQDVNEFSPEFERSVYELTLDLDSSLLAEPAAATPPRLLLTLRARDQDCSPEFGSVCRYELLESLDGLSVDSAGRLWMRRLPAAWLAQLRAADAQPRPLSVHVLAYDCAGKKSQVPARVELSFRKVCRAALKGK